MHLSYQGFFLIYFLLGFIWARSSVEKITEGTFVQNFPSIISKFVSKNPYEWYTRFLQHVVSPNAWVFSFLIMWGEFITAMLILTNSAYLFWFREKSSRLAVFLLALGLSGGFLLNLNFWLASGWMSPSSDTLNLFMMGVELVGVGILFNYLYTKN